MTNCDVFPLFTFAHLIGCKNFGGRSVPLKATWAPGLPRLVGLALPGLLLAPPGDFLGLALGLALLARLVRDWRRAWLRLVSFSRCASSISAFSSDQLQPCLLGPSPPYTCVCRTDPHHCPRAARNGHISAASLPLPLFLRCCFLNTHNSMARLDMTLAYA